MRRLISYLYTKVIKPLLFLLDPEFVHDSFVGFGKLLGYTYLSRKFTSFIFSYENHLLEKDLLGIKIKNPIGLSAGFDYDANLLKILPSVGFGFFTVGTVTNLPYAGNTAPRLYRLPKSKAILVNKGFKSSGVDVIARKLNDPLLKGITFGVSIGSSNVPQIDTIDKAIEDYCISFSKLKDNNYIKYFELNISCPNTCMTESFLEPTNFQKLINKIVALNISQPVLVKMPSEGSLETMETLVDIALKVNIKGFIFSNLVKDRNNPAIDSSEKVLITKLKGNISGVPTKQNSLKLVRHFRKKYGSEIVIIGCGGIFSPEDAKERLEAGADAVQLITGMIYEGPQLIGQINKSLSQFTAK